MLTDHGKHINTNVEVTVPANVFSGHSITIANTSNESGINLIQGSGLTLRNAGQTTTGDRVINNYGLVTYFLHLLLKLQWFRTCIMTHYNLLAARRFCTNSKLWWNRINF